MTLRRRFHGLAGMAACLCAAEAMAGDPSVPWYVTEPGYVVEVAAEDFQLPVCIAFIPEPGDAPDDPLYYVAELYGAIKVVARDGSVSDFATGLLNFNPTGNFPGSGEKGLGGIAVHPETGDVFATLVYHSVPGLPGAPFYPKVVRLGSKKGGRKATSVDTVLDMVGAAQAESHQISNITFGPDGLLYVHNGDGFTAAQARNVNSFLGKVLRMNSDGTAFDGNPYYSTSDGIGPRDYVWAYGFRNPFGGAWRVGEGLHYSVENGPSTDRLARIDAGQDYAWAGTDAQMQIRALYNWIPSHAPVAIAFVEPGVFGGSGFPPEKQGLAFVTESGGTWTTGVQANGKRIVAFDIAQGGATASDACPFVQYSGTGKSTAAGLVAGPDGLYFTDLYKDTDYASAIDRGARVLRVRYVGAAVIEAEPFRGPAPLDVRFEAGETLPPAVGWSWAFGDGTTSTERNPTHRYESRGVQSATLSIERADGTFVSGAPFQIRVEPDAGGFLATYYHGQEQCADPIVERIDPTIDFLWGTGSPDPAIPPDLYGARWSATVTPEFTQTYTFTARTDDGVRLRVNGQTLVDYWFGQGATDRSGNIALTAGVPVSIEMDYFETAGSAEARLFWQSPSRPREIVPTTRLTPPTDAESILALSATTVLDGVPFDVEVGVRCNGPVGAEDAQSTLVFDSNVEILGTEPSAATVETGAGSVNISAGRLESGESGGIL